MPPNIIFYFSDQQRWDTVNKTVMPNLCAFAESGTVFDNAFTCQPVCGPARACLQTGVYATQNGSYWNGIPLTPDIKPLAAYFNEAGYETAYVGKWHLASDRVPKIGFHCETGAVPADRRGGYKNFWRAADVLEFTSHGYDGYVFDGDGVKREFTGYRADCINNFALEYIDGKTSTDPFFLFISQIEPHHQNDRNHFEGKKETIERFRNYPTPSDLSFLKGNYKEEYPDYLSAINAIDDNLGRLVKRLKEKGLYDNTIILYTSDHGCHFKTRNMEYKRSCHDSCIHIPLVIFGGGYKGTGNDGRLVSLIDLPPTLLDLSGIEIPKTYRGQSLLNSNERGCVFLQISESQIGRAIRTKEFKYAVRALGSGLTGHKASVYFEDYLYDLRNDPDERHNLIKSAEYAKERSRLRAMLIKEMTDAGEARPRICPAVLSRDK